LTIDFLSSAVKLRISNEYIFADHLEQGLRLFSLISQDLNMLDYYMDVVVRFSKEPLRSLIEGFAPITIVHF